MNYFKVVIPHNHTINTFFPFNDNDVDETLIAWLDACALVQEGQTIAAHSKPELDGPWRNLPTVGEGIDGSALEAFRNGRYYLDDDDDPAN